MKRQRHSGKAIQPMSFALFGQCMHNPAPNPKAVFADLVSKTRNILQQTKCEQGGRIHLPDETEIMIEENVEMGEEEILRHDYGLERV